MAFFFDPSNQPSLPPDSLSFVVPAVICATPKLQEMTLSSWKCSDLSGVKAVIFPLTRQKV